MRWVGLAIILLSLPVFIAMLGQFRARRDLAVLAIGVLLFCVGHISPSAAVYVWPGWYGISKGISLSFIDSLALALLVTRPPARYRISFVPLIAVYLLTIAVSLVFADNRVAGAFVAAQGAQLALLFVALAGELQRPTAVRSLLKGLALGLLIQAAYVVREKLGGMVQSSGTFEHQNVLGLAVELSVLPMIAAVLEGERSKLIYAGIAAGAICVAGGGSRGTMGFVAMGAVLVVVGSVIRRGSRRKWQMVGLGAAGAIVAGSLAFATLTERFGKASFDTAETARSALAEAARNMAADHPFVGVGANNFVIANNVGRYIDRTGFALTEATRRQPAHNAYLVTRAERGFPGEVALILLLGGMATGALLTAFKYRRSAYAGIGLGASGAILSVSLHSNYEYALLTTNVLSLLFVIGGLISGLRVVAAREVAVPTVPPSQQKSAVARRQAKRGDVPPSIPEAVRETKP